MLFCFFSTAFLAFFFGGSGFIMSRRWSSLVGRRGPISSSLVCLTPCPSLLPTFFRHLTDIQNIPSFKLSWSGVPRALALYLSQIHGSRFGVGNSTLVDRNLEATAGQPEDNHLPQVLDLSADLGFPADKSACL